MQKYNELLCRLTACRLVAAVGVPCVAVGVRFAHIPCREPAKSTASIQSDCIAIIATTYSLGFIYNERDIAEIVPVGILFYLISKTKCLILEIPFFETAYFCAFS
jgi:hypothetical protein